MLDNIPLSINLPIIGVITAPPSIAIIRPAAPTFTSSPKSLRACEYFGNYKIIKLWQFYKNAIREKCKGFYFYDGEL